MSPNTRTFYLKRYQCALVPYLRSAMLDDLGLIPALRSFIKGLAGSKGLSIRFTAFAEVENLDNAWRTVLYRVAQERPHECGSPCANTLSFSFSSYSESRPGSVQIQATTHLAR